MKNMDCRGLLNNEVWDFRNLRIYLKEGGKSNEPGRKLP